MKTQSVKHPPNVTQMLQLITVTYDGDIIGKKNRDELERMGYVQRAQGFNWLTKKGVELLVEKGLLRP